MGQHGPHSAQTFSHAFDASGQVDYQSRLPDTGHRTGKSRARRALEPFNAHEFRDSRNRLVDNSQRGFRRDVSRRKSGSAGRDNQAECLRRRPREAAFSIASALIGQDLDRPHVEARFRKNPRGLGPGEIFAVACRSRITERENKRDPKVRSLPAPG